MRLASVGSSRVLSRALAAARLSASAGAITNTRSPLAWVVSAARSISSRMASMRIGRPGSSGVTQNRSGWAPVCAR